jgi:hypothetical protein
VLFFAMAAGIFIASRRAGWFALVYVSAFICLPRMYLGEHYATDILTGAAIGIIPVCLANLPRIRQPLTPLELAIAGGKPVLVLLPGFSGFVSSCGVIRAHDQNGEIHLPSCLIDGKLKYRRKSPYGRPFWPFLTTLPAP